MNRPKMIVASMLTLAVLMGSLPVFAAKKQQEAEPVTLTATGQKYQAAYESQLKKLEAELKAKVPKISEQKVAAYESAIADENAAKVKLAAAQNEMGAIDKARGLVGHAKNKWIKGAEQGIAKAKAALKNAKTGVEKEAAEKQLADWQKNLKAGQEALKERQAKYDRLVKSEDKIKKSIEDAQAGLAKAQANVAKAMKAMNVDQALLSDKLDKELAQYMILKTATPKGLAMFAQQGKAQHKLVTDMLNDTDMMVQMLVADGPTDNRYGDALTIYDNIQKASDKASEGTLQRLAMAIALEHAKPIAQRNPKAATDAPSHVDPVGRYLQYEKAFLNDELDPYFKDQSVYNMRFVVDGSEPDETLVWGREMLRNYRPDHITTDADRWRYVAAVRTEVRYGSQENKFDKDELQFYQNILSNGGICGRRAFFGRFILRAFGNPTTARPQRGHAALVRWTPNGWATVLGAGWGSGWTKTRYKADRDFLANVQAREKGGDEFIAVQRARWIGELDGEKGVYGLLDQKNQPDFWHGVALNKQREIINKAGAEELAGVGEELGEANETEVKYAFVSPKIKDADRKIHVESNGSIVIPAAATTKPTESTGKILFMDSVLGGKQLHYGRIGGDQDFEYTFDAPAAGKYNLTMKIASPSQKQKVMIIVNGKSQEVELPYTVGVFDDSKPIAVDLVKGKNTITFSRKGITKEREPKGFTLKQITLTPAGGRVSDAR